MHRLCLQLHVKSKLNKHPFHVRASRDAELLFQNVEGREADADRHRPFYPVHAEALEQPTETLLLHYRL